MNTPTDETYTEFQQAYNFFNSKLFGGRLPQCLITLQRHARTYGYFSPKRFSRYNETDLVTDEIAMNPEHFIGRDIQDILSTLVHEMVHLQQEHFGRPSRRSYHNHQWADMMRAVGLIPSDTGKEGGRPVGQRVSHYIERGGLFECACQELLKGGFTISWVDRNKAGDPNPAPTGRIKYRCNSCGLNAWAKPSISLICGTCDIELASLLR